MPKKTAQLKYWLSVTALLAIVFWSGYTFDQQVFQLPEYQSAVNSQTTSISLVTGETSEMYNLSLFNSLLNQFAANLEPYMYTLVTVWFLGVIFFLIRLQGSLIYLRRLKTTGIQPVPLVWQQKIEHMSRRLGIRSSIKIVESKVAEIPMVVGHLRPLILLPIGMLTGLQTYEVEAILAHELAHIKRFDYLINIAQSVIESVLFFNPAVWWISQTIRKQREHCCDDIAVKCCGNQMIYANALTNLGEWSVGTPTLGMGLFKNKNELLMRIKRLVYPQVGSRTVKEKLVPGIVLTLTLLCLTWYSHRVQAELMPVEHQYDFYPELSANMSLPQQVKDTVPKSPEAEEIEELPSMLPPFDADQPIETELDLEIDAEVDLDIDVPMEIELPMDFGIFVSPMAEELAVLSQVTMPEVFIDIDEIVDMDQVKLIIKDFQVHWNDTTRERILEALEQQREALERARVEQSEVLEKAREQLRQSLEADRPEDLTEEEWAMAKDQIRQAERSVERAMRQSARALEQALENHELELHENMNRAMRHMDHQAMVHKQLQRVKRDEERIRRNVGRAHRYTDRNNHRVVHRRDGKESRLRDMLHDDGLIDNYNSSINLEFKKDQIKINGNKLGGNQKEKYRKLLDEIYGENSSGSLMYTDD